MKNQKSISKLNEIPKLKLKITRQFKKLNQMSKLKFKNQFKIRLKKI